MDKQPSPDPWITSTALSVVFGLIAMLPVFPAPIQQLSLDTSLGRWCYGASLLAIAGWYVVVHRKEQRLAAHEQQQRDQLALKREAVAEQRHEAAMARSDQIIANQQEMLDLQKFGRELEKARSAVFRLSGSVGGPIIDAINVSANSVAHLYADRQRYVAAITATQGYVGPPDMTSGGFPRAQIEKATELLQGIEDNPPTTPEEARATAEELRLLNIKPVGSEVGTESNAGTVVYHNKDGVLSDQEGAPLPKPSEPDSGEQHPKADDA